MMTAMEFQFFLVTCIAGCGWILLFCYLWLPRTAEKIAGIYLPVLLAVAYGATMFKALPVQSGGFGSLQNLMLAHTNAELVLAGWIHYLAFDLFIGGWQIRQARSRRIPPALIFPCLFATLLLCPLGLLCHYLVRFFFLPAKALPNRHPLVQRIPRQNPPGDSSVNIM